MPPEYRHGPPRPSGSHYPRDRVSESHPLPVSAAAARRFLARRHLLAPPRSLPVGLDGVRAAFARLGSVQFDPLAVAGRNHDLVLHARVRDYEPAWTNELLYERRELFETYNKMLSLLPTTELPWYRQAWDRFAAEHQDAAFARHDDTVTHVLDEIRARGPLSSLDFERRATIDWYWGPTSEVRAVLEALFEAGVIGLARREGNRRYFDLTERLYPADLLAVRPDERDQQRHKLLSRYRAHGLLGEGGGAELWYGITWRTASGPNHGPRADVLAALRAELLASGDLMPVAVEGVRGRRYVLGSELASLQAAEQETAGAGLMAGAGVTFLAPLDPRLGPRPAAEPLRLRLSLGGLHASSEAALRLLRAADPLGGPPRGPHRAAHRPGRGLRPHPGALVGGGLPAAAGGGLRDGDARGSRRVPPLRAGAAARLGRPLRRATPLRGPPARAMTARR